MPRPTSASAGRSPGRGSREVSSCVRTLLVVKLADLGDVLTATPRSSPADNLPGVPDRRPGNAEFGAAVFEAWIRSIERLSWRSPNSTVRLPRPGAIIGGVAARP